MSGLTKDAVNEILAVHRVECTGLGEVTCRGCRADGWMSWPKFQDHVAELIVALAPPAPLGFCRKTQGCRLTDGHEGTCPR